MDRGVRVRVVASDFQRLEPRVQKMFRELEEATKDCTSFHLNLCVSYGGRGEITNAARRVCSDVAKGKIRSANEILEADLDRYMLTHGFPDPDLVLRTSGEHRLSNFLLWQLAYSEMVFVQNLLECRHPNSGVTLFFTARDVLAGWHAQQQKQLGSRLSHQVRIFATCTSQKY